MQNKTCKIWFSLLIYALAAMGSVAGGAAIVCFMADGSVELEVAQGAACCRSLALCTHCVDVPLSLVSASERPAPVQLTSPEQLAHPFSSLASTPDEILKRVIPEITQLPFDYALISLKSVVLIV
jgi:hypothetical protein